VRPKFSIIVVDCDTHTPREAAKRGVNSILAQTFRDFEVIFVHDGLKQVPYEIEFELGGLESSRPYTRFQHIDCLQGVASRKAWESIGFWHRNEYEADGYLYVELSSKYKPFYIEETLAENF
jgi:hypothetical protein